MTSAPTTPVVATATQGQTVTSSTMVDSTELGTTTDTVLKSKAKKINPPKKKPKDTLPPKIIAKKNGAPKNMTTKEVPPKPNPKKKTNVPAIEKPRGTGPKNSTEKATSKKTAPKKAPPKETLPKSNFPKKITPKNNTVSINTPKKIPPKKNPVQKAKPPPKKNVVQKPSPKKNTPPKKGNTKPTQTKVNPTKKLKSQPTNVTNSETSFSQKKTKEKKTNPKKTTLKTTPSYYPTTLSPFTNPENTRDPSSTVLFYTRIYGITTETPFTESKVNDMYGNNHSMPTKESLQWNQDALVSTPSTSHEETTVGTGLVEDSYIPSGTAPYGETTMTNSGDTMVTSGIIISDDDMAVSYSNVGVASDTLVLDDGLTVLIPTIRNEDMTDLVSSPWLDLTEYIPVTVPAPMSVPDVAATAAPTIEERVPTAGNAPTLGAKGRPEENGDSNYVDVLENRGAVAENDVSTNNSIPRRRVNFRERTKNKRIQELLEEKRNFLLRTKRGHAP